MCCCFSGIYHWDHNGVIYIFIYIYIYIYIHLDGKNHIAFVHTAGCRYVVLYFLTRNIIASASKCETYHWALSERRQFPRVQSSERPQTDV